MTIDEIGGANHQFAINTLGEDAITAYTVGEKVLGVLNSFVNCIGVALANFCSQNMGAGKEDAALYVTITLVFLSALFTGLNLYQKLTKYAGAGSVVPITGSANSVAASAIEYSKEGQVFGIGCKIFTIAGPVILYGILTSWGLGLIYWILKLLGIA